jgi:hypothetical protein
MYSRQVMTKYLEIMKAQAEFEHVKGVPPLDIILYRGTINLGDLILLLGLRVSIYSTNFVLDLRSISWWKHSCL